MTDTRGVSHIVVVGAGPAGIAAACEAAESGHHVTVVEQTPWLGGQIWRGEETHATSFAARRWIERVKHSGAAICTQTSIVAAPSPHALLAETPQGSLELKWDKLILACGARELFVPFPGWTLPHVVGAGGLHTLVKNGWPIAGKHVVVAGSGPLLLAVAAGLKKHGAEIRLIAEQTPWLRLSHFGLAVAPHAGKGLQGMGIGLHLLGAPYRCGWWPVRADGHDQVDTVVLTNGVRQKAIPCDLLACAFGLTANLELPALLGCMIQDGCVRVDEWQQTTCSDIYCAGEPTGIGGVDGALVEGRIAGLSAGGWTEKARRLFAGRRSWHRFRGGLQQAFQLREELKSLAAPDTIVCRCEDVTRQQLASHASWRAAKLQTRCGMGPCQGRTCSAAAQFLFGWSGISGRPPVLPTRLATLMSTSVDTASTASARKEQHESASQTQGHNERSGQASVSHPGLH
jgi:NADPH-dependent 2,4-dienoyl-CoA reductase/sulfur reductase-like enzyme